MKCCYESWNLGLSMYLSKDFKQLFLFSLESYRHKQKQSKRRELLSVSNRTLKIKFFHLVLGLQTEHPHTCL